MASNNNSAPATLAIVVGGGPAPGINGVIAAVTIEARNNGLRVIGFIEGFKYPMTEGAQIVPGHYRELRIEDVSRIHFMGGSVLRTSRSNPTKKEEHMKNTLDCLHSLNVKYLVTIGGDDTAFSSMTVASKTGGSVRVCHVPKTIDNDLPLPRGIPTFGYQTAREYGADIVRNLMEDAKTAPRYFIVVAMGRQAGHLALGIGMSAGAHLTLIPEEFRGRTIKFAEICDIIEGCVLKRKVMGKDHGVVVLAEGLLENMDQQEIVQIFGQENVKFDPHGHIMLAELDIAKAVRDEMRNRISFCSFTEKMLGYELRCAPPNAYDREYTRELGYGAVKYLLNDGNGALITSQGGKIVPMTFEELRDPATNRTRVRAVDVDSEGYEVAVRYMIRLNKKDFENNEEMVEKMAKLAGMETAAFKTRYNAVAI